MMLAGDLNKIYTEVNRVTGTLLERIEALEERVRVLELPKPSKPQKKVDKS